MFILVLSAYVRLIEFDSHLKQGDFSALYKRVRNCQLCSDRAGQESVERICAAVDMASIWYWKEMLCLQRSAATTCLLRRYGINAVMVIGAQPMPFKAHAWVEVDGRVVNDKPYMPEKYAVLDRC
ncbi:MAG TPA: lasso peptide biosynthesis B2 protein [Nitrospira sp.]|nr:lasso peptide biosynthesis B2 protein [Nitrospira sp.]